MHNRHSVFSLSRVIEAREAITSVCVADFSFFYFLFLFIYLFFQCTCGTLGARWNSELKSFVVARLYRCFRVCAASCKSGESTRRTMHSAWKRTNITFIPDPRGMSRGTIVHIRDKAQEMEIQSVVERERLIIFLGRAWRIARVSWAEDQRIHAFLMPPGLHRVPLPYSFIPREKEREREREREARLPDPPPGYPRLYRYDACYITPCGRTKLTNCSGSGSGTKRIRENNFRKLRWTKPSKKKYRMKNSMTMNWFIGKKCIRDIYCILLLWRVWKIMPVNWTDW